MEVSKTQTSHWLLLGPWLLVAPNNPVIVIFSAAQTLRLSCASHLLDGCAQASVDVSPSFGPHKKHLGQV